MKQGGSKKREAILIESFKLFLLKGYDAVSFTDIERVAQVTRGAIFHHFKSKEDLFQHVADRFVFAFFQEVDYGEEYLESSTPLKVFMAKCLSIIEERMTLFEQHIDTEITPAGFLRFILYLKDHHDIWIEKVRAYETQRIQAWIKTINLSKERKEVRSDTDALLLAETLHHLYLGLSYKGAMIDRLSIPILRRQWEYIYQQQLIK